MKGVTQGVVVSLYNRLNLSPVKIWQGLKQPSPGSGSASGKIMNNCNSNVFLLLFLLSLWLNLSNSLLEISYRESIAAKPCPEVQPPSHGSVVLPCIEQFNSTCFLECRRGYYSSGNDITSCIVENNATSWKGGNLTCIGNCELLLSDSR